VATRRRAWRRVVFVALLVLLPVPMLLFDGRVPTANLYLMSAVCAAFWAREGAAGPVRTVTLLLAAHAAAYTVLLWGVAWVADRGLDRLSPRARRLCVLVPVAIAAAVALAVPVYVTPFARTPRSTLLGALE
jgi:hypothetical protein